MTHHVYRTNALILTTTPVAEANRYYYLLTKDFGVVGATAQGVRWLKSKLKFALQPLSLSEISLVKGRNGWKIINAYSEKNYFYQFKENIYARAMIARVLSLVRRLVIGEDINKDLYNTIISHINFLEQNMKLSVSDIELIEYRLVFCILYTLGYLPHSDLALKVVNGVLDEKLLLILQPQKKMMLEQINRSLRATQL